MPDDKICTLFAIFLFQCQKKKGDGSCVSKRKNRPLVTSIDENGIVQEVIYDVQVKLLTSLHVEKCVEITFVLISRFCNAKADGLIFHWQ